MGYDFSNVAEQAKEAIESSNNNSSSYKYSMIYPAAGQLTVRLLYNPASNLISRLINRHTIGKSKFPCLKTYDQECPICKALDNIKNASGTDLWSKFGSKVRGLSFAQYVSSTYAVGSDRYPVNQGDVVLLMYPWTIYKEIQKFINDCSSSPTGMTKAFALAEASVVTISRDNSNQYSFMPSAYNTFKSASSDEEFTKMLDSQESLLTQILKESPDQEMIDQINGVANELTNQYLSGRVSTPPNLNPSQNPTSITNVATTQATQQSQSIAPDNNTPTIPDASGNPDCFGKHDETSKDSPIKCALCTFESSCAG